MWWAVQSLTSLGYGDFTPQTLLGKVLHPAPLLLNPAHDSQCVGSICAVCGVLVMALPIPIVVDNFASYYSQLKRLEVEQEKREARRRREEEEVES